MWGKCEECGKVLEEVWKGEMWVEVWGCGEVLGKMWEHVLECGGGKGRSGKMCWGVGKVGGDVGVLGEV